MQTSVVKYKELNFELRIDAEYHRAEVLEKIHLLDKKSHDILENLASFVVGPFGSTDTLKPLDVPSGPWCLCLEIFCVSISLICLFSCKFVRIS